jgi:carboxylesterase type B
LKAGGAARVPILTGSNTDEGLLSTGRIFFNKSLKEEVSKNWNELSPNFFHYEKSNKELTTKIRNFYIGDDPSQPLSFDEKFQNITNAFSDRLYIHALRETVKIQSQWSPIYLYYFNYPLYRSLVYLFDINSNYPILPQFVWKEIKWFLNEIFKIPNLSLGVGHGDEISLIFQLPLFDISPKSKDFLISQFMVNLWANFTTDP